ncbi:rCG49004, isoform CRA_b [Rattus norvegicus]|uniref:RCG49004, isoform CRA_b n=1 Tax=Rattus norvegicus TaxID=10116 RepID=A6IG49_RAT|nr:rCG49004, isoform CRA_b [Rattus norvegicus]
MSTIVLTAEPFHTPLGQRSAGSQGQVQRPNILSKATRSTLEGWLLVT